MSIPSFFKVRIKTLISGSPVGFGLYIRLGDKNVIYLRPGDQLNQEKMDQLVMKDSGNHFYIREEDRGAYRAYLRDQMSSSANNVAQKTFLLRESSMNLMEDLFESPEIGYALEQSRPLVKEFVNLMDSEPTAMAHLISLSGHDFYTYSHSLDVAIYSMGLSRILTFTPNEVEEMGLGALFHDIGKRQISLDILTKKGPLDEDEWGQMRKHPQYGLVLLNEQNVSDAVKAACFEHHESFIGNGYPQELSGQEIHPFGRIVAITDTYDAMTTQRSYNVPLKPFDALTFMKEKLAGRYDPEMLKAMHSVLFKMKANS